MFLWDTLVHLTKGSLQKNRHLTKNQKSFVQRDDWYDQWRTQNFHLRGADPNRSFDFGGKPRIFHVDFEGPMIFLVFSKMSPEYSYRFWKCTVVWQVWPNPRAYTWVCHWMWLFCLLEHFSFLFFFLPHYIGLLVNKCYFNSKDPSLGTYAILTYQHH